MDEKPNQILNEIDQTRDRLGRNLGELENRLKDTVDWRTQFERHPVAMMGAAFGGGLLLSSFILGGSGSRSSRSSWAGSSSRSNFSSAPSPGTHYQKQKAVELIDNVRGALIGLAATRLKTFLAEAVPGFQEHFQETEQKTQQGGTAHSSSASPSHSAGTGTAPTQAANVTSSIP